MLELHGIAKRLGAFSLADVNLRLQPDEYFVLLGPSGVGKTVLLEVTAGLVRPDSGRILWQGKDITDVPPERRGFAVVYQDYALFPHLSVAENIAYGLKARGESRPAAAKKARALARKIGIAHLLGRRPENLSGGEQQRVALARALVTEPHALLLDEPLCSVDANARARLRKELKRIHRRTATTFFHVTHDTDEALHLGDRVGVMLGGTIRQVGSPEELFRKPSDPEVAQFLGMRNILPVTFVRPGVCQAYGVEIHAVCADESASFIWIRPEEILLSEQPFDSSARNQLRCTVDGWEHSGILLAVRLTSGALRLTALITHKSFEALGVQAGSVLHCTFKSSAVHCF
ncbi:MAG: ATP-binding cassette domain-containing protein [Candidatus Brocadiae bacterium]|nr:ATP-binding cassette domain-containing protein [Candidatus Brocadiia bacterium]